MEEVYAERYFRALKRRLALGRSAVINPGDYAGRLPITVIAASRLTVQPQAVSCRNCARHRTVCSPWHQCGEFKDAAIFRLLSKPLRNKVFRFAAGNEGDVVAGKLFFFHVKSPAGTPWRTRKVMQRSAVRSAQKICLSHPPVV